MNLIRHLILSNENYCNPESSAFSNCLTFVPLTHPYRPWWTENTHQLPKTWDFWLWQQWI